MYLKEPTELTCVPNSIYVPQRQGKTGFKIIYSSHKCCRSMNTSSERCCYHSPTAFVSGQLDHCFLCAVLCLLTQLCPTLCNPMDYSLPGSSVHGILQARILEWTAMSSSRGSSQPRDRTQVSRLIGGFFTRRATREAPIAFCPKPNLPTGAPAIALHSGIQPTALCQGGIVSFFGVKQRGIQILPLLLLIVPLDKLGNLTKAYLSKRSDRPYLTGLLQR